MSVRFYPQNTVLSQRFQRRICAHLSTPTALPKAYLPCSTAWTGFSKQPTPTHFVSLLQDTLQKDINTGHWSFSTGYPDFPDSRLSKSVERYIKNQDIHSQFLDDSSILLNLDAVLNMINPIQPFMLLHSPAFGARRVWKVSTCSPTWKGTSVGHGEAIAWVRWKKDGIRPHKLQGAQASGTNQNWPRLTEWLAKNRRH